MTATVSFREVSKRYRRGRERVNLRAVIPGRLGDSSGGDVHWALRDVSFELPAGRSLGIVGPNGAGKSTLLKLVANVIAPTSGDIEVRGRSASLIELGAGFHPDMTGRENVYFSAAVLGMGPRSLRRRFDQIVEFADIGGYLDSPVKRYSSGMMARLGFAVASHLDADLLVLDEVLAVGDAAFQRKCHERIGLLRREGAALLYVTHALWTLPQLCDEAILLVAGQVERAGRPAEVLEAYDSRRQDAPAGPAAGVLGSVGVSSAEVAPGGTVTVTAEVHLPEAAPEARLMVLLARPDDTYLGATVSDSGGIALEAGTTRVECRIESLLLQPGEYILGVVFFADRRVPVFDDARRIWIRVPGEEGNPAFGSMHIPATWTSLPGSGPGGPIVADPVGKAGPGSP